MSYEFQSGEYKTRDGREARIYAIDGRGGYPLHGAVLDSGGWNAATWDRAGRLIDNEKNDLDLMPPKRVWYVNVYRRPEESIGHTTREDADMYARDDRVACVRVEEGQFDE